MTHEIFAPSEGEALQIGENMTSYSLSLGDGLMSALKFSKVRCRMTRTFFRSDGGED